MTARVRRECVRFQLSKDLSSQLQTRGSWPVIPGISDIGEATDEVSARPEYQPLQDEFISFDASQSKDFDDEQDEDVNSVFGYDEVDCDNSEVIRNQAKADETTMLIDIRRCGESDTATLKAI
ncbi:hypothetical protein BKA60DRAFT_600672 [Fusarium oxysporum]|nr:hypothetical protein BKA60DRAFT_600672 [Fusarium oxysporum]